MPLRTLQRPGRALTVLLVALVAGAGGAAAGYFLAGKLPSSAGKTDAGTATDKRDRITALGRLQPLNGVVPVYGPPGDRIGKMYLTRDKKPIGPGTALKAGDEIADLASRHQRLLEIDVARTQLNEAEAASAAAKVAGDQKVIAAEAELNQATANKESDLKSIDAKIGALDLQVMIADKQLKRAETLKAAPEDLERLQLLKAKADAELAATKAVRTKTETTYTQSEKAATAKIEAAKAEAKEALARVPLESSKVKLKLAEETSDLTVIKAPVTGTVLKVVGREGQPTGIDPILQMADLGQMTAVAEVYESDVRQLRDWVNKGVVTAEITNPALPKPLTGAVRSEADITRMIARNQVFALGPREDADRRVVEVVVYLDPSAAADAGRFVGLQVTVTLTPGR